MDIFYFLSKCVFLTIITMISVNIGYGQVENKVPKIFQWNSQIVDLFENDRERDFTWLIYSNDPSQLSIDLFENDIEYQKPTDNVFKVFTSISKLTELNQQFITYLSIESSEVVLESNVFDHDLSVNAILNTQQRFPLINNAPVSIRDFRFANTDLDLLGHSFVSNFSFDQMSQHASDMATIVSGNGINSVTSLGVFPNNDIFSTGFNDILPVVIDYYNDNEIRIENHSYGTQIEYFYGISAMEYDRQLKENPELLHIFSSGNEGESVSPSGQYQDLPGFATITGNFKQSKNSLSVGATDLNGNVLSFSSKGPAYDGRIKPELVAYSNLGTSNANALVSGSSARLQSYYQELNGRALNSDLLRSILIASADDVGRKEIDFETGYGSLNLSKAHEIIEGEQYFIGQVRNNRSRAFLLTIPEDLKRLQISLSWIDQESAPNEDRALINDLDLELRSPSNEIILPWVLDDSPNEASLISLPTRTQDHLNNNEIITLEDVSAGVYRIIVRGFDLVETQDFAISYRMDAVDQFEWIYPLSGQTFSFDGSLNSAFRWNSGFENTSGELQFENADGIFETFTEVDLASGFFEYAFDDLPEGINNVRMRIGDSVFETGDFIVSKQPIIRVGGLCEDELVLFFSDTDENVDFELQQLDESTLNFETIATTSSSSISLEYEENARYRVVPLYDGIEGVQSVTIEPSDVDFCYFNSLSAIAFENAIEIEGFIATDHLIENIQLFKLIDGEFEFIIEGPFIDNEFVFQDLNPSVGLNSYIVRLERSGSFSIESEVVQEFFTPETEIVVSPNPANRSDGLVINLNESFVGNSTITLFDTQGRVLFIQDVNSTNLFVETQTFPTGLILYSVAREDGFSIDGQLVVN